MHPRRQFWSSIVIKPISKQLQGSLGSTVHPSQLGLDRAIGAVPNLQKIWTELRQQHQTALQLFIKAFSLF